jgi:hypothetical protein
MHTIDHVEVLRASEKFQSWKKPGRVLPVFSGVERSFLMNEPHYTPTELAEMWGVSVQTIREIFKEEEGVLKIGRDGTRLRRAYKTLRIPHSVAERVHSRLSA